MDLNRILTEGYGPGAWHGAELGVGPALHLAEAPEVEVPAFAAADARLDQHAGQGRDVARALVGDAPVMHGAPGPRMTPPPTASESGRAAAVIAVGTAGAAFVVGTTVTTQE